MLANKTVAFCKQHRIPYKTLRDEEVLVSDTINFFKKNNRNTSRNQILSNLLLSYYLKNSL